jgi:DNA polymerase (family 10)
MNREEVFPIAFEVEQVLIDEGFNALVCGSLRRMCLTVRDANLAVSGPIQSCLEEIRKHWKVTDMSIDARRATVLINNIQFWLQVADKEEWGAMTLALTGSKLFNILIRGVAKTQGLKLNEYGLWHLGERIAGRDERQIFEALGLEYLDPIHRNLMGKSDPLPKIKEGN